MVAFPPAEEEEICESGETLLLIILLRSLDLAEEGISRFRGGDLDQDRSVEIVETESAEYAGETDLTRFSGRR